ncbi:MAG: hypothetical protein GY913_12315 [Proteobacteria bacterium]|nr:hypothetical protein [Pseudomonadota bacterium]MCP4917700.1 hypothetical protein [Pseudomonadota bacterium]
MLFWPLPLHLTTHLPDGAFTGVQMWSMGHMARMVGGDLPLQLETVHIGYPNATKAQFLAWVPALVMTPVSLLVSPLAAFNLALLLSPVVATVFAYLWLRQATTADRETSAAAAFLYSTSAYVLANLAAGNIDKLQVWLYPAWLALAWWTLRGGRRWLVLPVFVLAGTAMAFTEPYFALFLPLFAGPLLVARAAGNRSRREGLLSLAMLGASGLGMLPARWYYANDGPLDMSVLFAHSVVSRHTTPPDLQEPVASLGNLLLGPMGQAPSPTYNVHACAIGLALLVATLALARRPSEGRGWGWAMAGLGLVLASGPQLLLGGEWRLEPVFHAPFYLPMELLERIGYPLAKGGQYYRATPILTLGIVTAFAAGATTLAPRVRRAVLGAVVTLTLAQAVWTTGPFWPHPSAALGTEWLAVLEARGEPDDPVAVLPLNAEQKTNDIRVAQAALHRHPITPVPRHMQMPEMMSQVPWALGMRMQGIEAYRQMGVRFVVLHKGEDDTLDAPWMVRDAQQEMLGEPFYEDEDVVLFEVTPRPR